MIQNKYKTLLTAAGLTIAVLAVFGRVHRFDFVNYDDDKYVSRNEHILSGLTIRNIVWAFTSEQCGNWHPLTAVSHMLDCELLGLNPGRHHLVNLLFHLANTLLIFVIFRQMTEAFWQSAFVAAVFGLHPLHVESVAWISERKDVLSTVFCLLTIAAYFNYVKNPKISRYISTVFLFALGLMTKPILVTLPFVLLLLDYWPLNRFELKISKLKMLLKLVWEKTPFFILSTVSGVITFTVQKSAGTVAGIQGFPLTSRIANAVASYVEYIAKMIWPADLAVFYPYLGHIPTFKQVFASAVLLLIITIAVIRLGGKYKYLPVGWFWYVGTLVPVIGLMQAGEQSMADRYTYIPLIGLFIIIAWGANDLSERWKYKKPFLVFFSSAVISIFAVLTWFQVGYWRDSMSLFERAIRVTRGNYVAYCALGTVYYNQSKYDLAIATYNNAIKINPRSAEAYNNRGSAYTQGKGEYDIGIRDYNKAIEINPKHAQAYFNRANAYAQGKGAYDLAISDFTRALEIKPGYTAAYNNRGNTYAVKGELDHAISDYNRALAINPRDAGTCLNKAIACESMGRKKEAVDAYKAFIQYAPAQYMHDIEQVKQKIKQLEQ